MVNGEKHIMSNRVLYYCSYFFLDPRFNITLSTPISLGSDGSENFSGSIAGVRKRLSEKAQSEIPYIRCRAHYQLLALTSARNKYVSIEQTLRVVKD